jgi:type III pantothenate kinase
MLLAIDVGNTNTVFGLDDGPDGWARQWRLTTIASQAADDWAVPLLTLAAHDGIALSDVSGVCICSVVPKATLALSEFARGRLGIEPLLVRSDLELNIRLGMDHPAEVGADRIANAAAAWEARQSAVIVVDLGTATKVEAISGDGTFEGGSIAAGLGVTLDALASRAARLFTVQLADPVSAIAGRPGSWTPPPDPWPDCGLPGRTGRVASHSCHRRPRGRSKFAVPRTGPVRTGPDIERHPVDPPAQLQGDLTRLDIGGATSII